MAQRYYIIFNLFQMSNRRFLFPVCCCENVRLYNEIHIKTCKTNIQVYLLEVGLFVRLEKFHFFPWYCGSNLKHFTNLFN